MEDIQKIIDESVDRAIAKYSDRPTMEHDLSVEDVVFLHTIRKQFSRVTNIVGTAVILAILSAVFFIVRLGLSAWKTQ